MTSNNFGRQPVRYTGQHFTQSTSLIHDMIKKACITKKDMVLDIGAGKGAITKPLSHHAKRVIAIERDSRLAADLNQSFASFENVNILNMDIQDMPLPNRPFKVVSNIPYGITTDLFGKLMDTPDVNFIEGVFIIQWGSALRFTKAKQANPRILGWNTWFEIVGIRKVSRRLFQPPPTVTSAMVKINRRKKPVISQNDHYDFMSFASSLLQNHGVYTKEVLRKIFTKKQVKRMMTDAGIPRHSLIQDLDIPQWGHCFYTMLKLIPKAVHPNMPDRYKKLYR